MDIKKLNEELRSFKEENKHEDLIVLLKDWLKSLQFSESKVYKNCYERLTEDTILNVFFDANTTKNGISIKLEISGSEVFNKIVSTTYDIVDIIKDIKDIIVGKKVA